MSWRVGALPFCRNCSFQIALPSMEWFGYNWFHSRAWNLSILPPSASWPMPSISTVCILLCQRSEFEGGFSASRGVKRLFSRRRRPRRQQWKRQRQARKDRVSSFAGRVMWQASEVTSEKASVAIFAIQYGRMRKCKEKLQLCVFWLTAAYSLARVGGCEDSWSFSPSLPSLSPCAESCRLRLIVWEWDSTSSTQQHSAFLNRTVRRNCKWTPCVHNGVRQAGSTKVL